jgi:glycosyltransferase involved in cell wall biosynthesis
MRLLILTQKVDKDDPILGFFHTWILRLAGKYESLIVICLQEGKHDLPANVKVLSLGKEESVASSKHLAARIKYSTRFYRYVWRERNNYDAVFVHMNQEYVLLGGLFWKLLGKKIYLWRNHPRGNILTRVAIALSNQVFATSRDAHTARFKKTQIMPAGIDTDLFRTINYKLKTKNSLLFFGRIAPIKRPDLLIEALEILKERGVKFEANIYGDALPKDREYFESLKKTDLAQFHGAVSNGEAPEIYAAHQIYVNLTPSGSLDKTILEAALSGCIPIITNTSLDFPPDLVVGDNPQDLAKKLEFWLSADQEKIKETSEKLQSFVLENHSLDALIERLEEEIR